MSAHPKDEKPAPEAEAKKPAAAPPAKSDDDFDGEMGDNGRGGGSVAPS